jgi:uncharacterized protein
MTADMLFKGRRQSGNVEDIRGRSGVHPGIIGGGIGTVILVVLGLIFNVDLSGLLPSTGQADNSTVTEERQLSDQEKGEKEFYAVILAYTEDVWSNIFSQSRLTYRMPRLVLFDGAAQSACGFAQSATGPFYCPGDQKVYIDPVFLKKLQQRLGANGDFAVAYIVAHEVGHHVQNLLGTMDKVHELQSQARSEEQVNRLTVSLELQADFLAGVFIHYLEKVEGQKVLETGDLEEALNAAAAVGDDIIQMKTRGQVVPDSFTHGSSKQRKSWLKKGIETGDYRQGNTFARNVEL